MALCGRNFLIWETAEIGAGLQVQIGTAGSTIKSELKQQTRIVTPHRVWPESHS
jgi:hypothetical protein